MEGSSLLFLVLTSVLTPGDLVERYQVIKLLGQGGMGQVYLVRDTILKCHCVIKILDPKYQAVAEIRERFWFEGHIQAQGTHPNIIRVFSTVSNADVTGIVMEFVDGPNLEEYVQGLHRAPSVQDILDLFVPIVSAVDHAHRQKVIHRDIKPPNILIAKGPFGPVAKIGDFGIAKAERYWETRTGQTPGTHGYMSPEQIKTPDEIDHRSDIFSLGCTLYELATLRQAFEGKTVYDVQQAAVNGRYIPPERRGADPMIAVIIHRALRVSRTDRYQSCDELLRDLEAVRASLAGSRGGTSGMGKVLLAAGAGLIGGLGFLTGYGVHEWSASGGPSVASTDFAVPRAADLGRLPPSDLATPRRVRRSTPPDLAAVSVPDLATTSTFPPGLRQLPPLPASSRRPALIAVEAGSCAMGSRTSDESPPRTITLTHGFYVAETEITRAQYRAVMGNSQVTDGTWIKKLPLSPADKQRLPMADLTWFDAIRYCNRLSALERLPLCYGFNGSSVEWPAKHACLGYRLPTEAEWEYVASATSSTAYPGSAVLDDVAWTGLNSGLHPHPVKQKRPNGWGLFDLAGNIAEWVWDDYSPYQADAVVDPINEERPQGSKPCRVLRGAGWDEVRPNRFRVKNRVCFAPDQVASVHGFRIVRTIPSTP